jgi:hypothetical protein
MNNAKNEADSGASRSDAGLGADCEHRCKRQHSNCTLSLARSIAPDHIWHWAVTMPGGHLWEVKTGMTFTQAVESMATDGAKSLAAADQRWRASNGQQ